VDVDVGLVLVAESGGGEALLEGSGVIGFFETNRGEYVG
jgi:hypothetical protein